MTTAQTTTTLTTQTTYERAIARANSAHIDVIGAGRLTDGRRFYLVPAGSQPGRVHVVRIDGAHLTCDCEAGAHGRYCIHRAVTHRHLAQQAQQRRALGRERARGEQEEHEEARRRSPEGAQGQHQGWGRYPLRWTDDAAVSMWK